MHALNMDRPSIEDIKDYSQHIVQNTYLWTDGLQSYSVLSTEKQCTIKQMKDRKQYDAVNHLNHMNSLHSRIEAQYERYRSVASKYINRYAALFRIQELYRKINVQEMITSLLLKMYLSIIPFPGIQNVFMAFESSQTNKGTLIIP